MAIIGLPIETLTSTQIEKNRLLLKFTDNSNLEYIICELVQSVFQQVDKILENIFSVGYTRSPALIKEGR